MPKWINVAARHKRVGGDDFSNKTYSVLTQITFLFKITRVIKYLSIKSIASSLALSEVLRQGFSFESLHG